MSKAQDEKVKGNIYHRLVVDRSFCDGNHFEHDGAL